MRQKGLKIVCACLCAAMLLPCRVWAKGSDSTPVPADAVSGGVIHSNIYGEVLITVSEDGQTNYSFFDTDIPATKQLLAALNSGKQIDLTKLLTESSTQIQNIVTNDKLAIPNDIENSGAVASGNRGSFNVGSIYGSDLNQKELDELQLAVSGFMIQNNVASMSDLQKVRTAHDFLVRNCVPASKGSRNHADNAWGALIWNEANAKGYARGMKALCDAMGIGNYVISANGNSSLKDYMWNTVMIDGSWYIVDVFCDDSTNSYTTYLLSDKAYQTLGMRWNAGSSVPICKKNYGQK